MNFPKKLNKPLCCTSGAASVKLCRGEVWALLIRKGVKRPHGCRHRNGCAVNWGENRSFCILREKTWFTEIDLSRDTCIKDRSDSTHEESFNGCKCFILAYAKTEKRNCIRTMQFFCLLYLVKNGCEGSSWRKESCISHFTLLIRKER